MSPVSDLLSKLFPIKILDKLEKGELNIKPKLLSENKFYKVENGSLYINYAPTYIVQTEKVLKGLISKDDAFLNFNRNKGIETLMEYKDNSSDDVVEFFRGKIPEEDFIILSISKYIKKLYDSNQRSKGDSKRQEIQRWYGQRGLNIYNLYSAKYFENNLRPLYELLADSDNPNFLNDFKEILTIYIDNPSIIFFVSNSKNYDETKKLFDDLVCKNISFGIYRVNIHGINKENIQKILHLVEDYKEQIEREETKYSGDSIMVKLTLKRAEDNCLPQRRGMLAELTV